MILSSTTPRTVLPRLPSTAWKPPDFGSKSGSVDFSVIKNVEQRFGHASSKKFFGKVVRARKKVSSLVGCGGSGKVMPRLGMNLRFSGLVTVLFSALIIPLSGSTGRSAVMMIYVINNISGEFKFTQQGTAVTAVKEPY